MKIETYFAKTGKIYGVSYKYFFGWKYYGIEFDDLDDAKKWLRTETYNFCTRELGSKSYIKKMFSGISFVKYCDLLTD